MAGGVGGGFIAWAIARPVSITVGVILVVLFGALSVADLPIQLTPDVTVPSISVSTTWPGATPTEIESDILEPQEEALKSLPGLVRMEGEARQNQGSVTLELEVGTDLQEALVRVGNLLAQVPDYPPAAREPVVSTADSGGPPLAVLVIQADGGGPVAEYRTWVRDVILPRLERIKGVAGIRLIGGQEQEVHVDFDPAALAARGVTVAQVARAVQAELRDVSGGDIAIGKRAYVVRTEVVPATPAELERVVLATRADGTPVRLGDVAKVRFGLRKAEAVGMMNGTPSMALLFYREPGTNVLEVTEEIHAVTAELQAQYLAREGLEMTVVSDQTDYINGALDLVQQNLLLGGALAVIVLLLFLRSVGASLVVAISIPVSVVGTVLGMSLVGRTVNIVSLAGMAFAIGMVVDNSIVVLENIDTRRKRDPDIKTAALLGTREVWGAILASTLTTAAVFIPIIGWQDEVGELLRDIAVAISISVFASLLVSVLVIPSFSARLLRGQRKMDFSDDIARPKRVRAGIQSAVHYITRSWWRAALVAVVGLGGTTWLGLSFVPAMEYLPTGNRNIVFGIVVPPPGYAVGEMQDVGERISAPLVAHTGKSIDGKPAIARSFFVGGGDQAFMGAVAEDETRVKELVGMVRAAQAQVPGVFGFASQAALFGRRLGSGRSIEVDLTGPDLGALAGLGGRLMGALSQALPGAQIRPIPTLDLGAPEFKIEPRRWQTTQLAMPSSELGLTVDAIVDGAIIGELAKTGEPKRDVVLRAVGHGVHDPRSLLAAPVATESGQVTSLGRLAELTEQLGPTIIKHIERRRAITLQVSPDETMPLEDAIRVVRDDVIGELEQAGQLPPDVRVDISGTAGQLETTQARFGWVLLLAVLICYLLLSALFEDFLAPLAILVTVPLAGAGGILFLRAVDAWLAPTPLDMMTALGFVILIGVVVNNAILVVDGALVRMREEGEDRDTAVAAAVRARVRPILMTTTTSLAGLLPMVLFPGSGSELYRGVGAVVLGGLALSTLLTLFVVPSVFSLLWRTRRLG